MSEEFFSIKARLFEIESEIDTIMRSQNVDFTYWAQLIREYLMLKDEMDGVASYSEG